MYMENRRRWETEKPIEKTSQMLQLEQTLDKLYKEFDEIEEILDLKDERIKLLEKIQYELYLIEARKPQQQAEEPNARPN